jgi:predicted molibdopterin-dependent oxidoreductase YjgC
MKWNSRMFSPRVPIARWSAKWCSRCWTGRWSGRRRPNRAQHEGRLCIKGRTVHEFIQYQDRLATPLWRRNDSLRTTYWDKALYFSASELKRLIEGYGPESVAFVGSARCINEETYIFQKFAPAVFGHKHIDHCARL